MLRYPFTRFDTPGGAVLRPLLPVRLRYGDRTLPTELLVDSGADGSMISLDPVRHPPRP